MTQEEIIEGNKLIAEFMGESCYGFIQGSSNIHRALIQPKDFKKYEELGYTLGLEYHSSYDWLMPVVENIENINNDNSYLYSFEMGKDWCAITTNDFKPETIVAKSVSGNKIQSVWLAVVEFIKWYNQK